MQLGDPYRTVLKLGTAQTLAWASSYYLPAILAAPMARELNISVATVFAAFSVGLLVSAFAGPRAGRIIDSLGGRPVLVFSNAVLALGLAGLGCAGGRWSLFTAWMVIGIGMAAGLYEAAFATLVKLYGNNSRNPITGITLLAGFASTVGWPLSTALEAWIGWRGTCFAWAAVHVLIALPLNLSLPRIAPDAKPGVADALSIAPDGAPTAPLKSAVLLGVVFAATWFISTAMAAHLPALLNAVGVSVAVAVTAGALIGPAQVAGRLLEFGMLRRVHPLFSARMAASLHPVAAIALIVFGGPAALAFAILHGAGNGVLTIAKGTLPLALFGPNGYGERQGILMIPARLAQALSPWLFGLCVEQWGAGALWVSAALGGVAVAALWALDPLNEPAVSNAKDNRS